MNRERMFYHVCDLMSMNREWVGEIGLAALYEMMFSPLGTYPIGCLASDGRL